MNKYTKYKKFFYLILSMAVLGYGSLLFFHERKDLSFSEPKTISINDNGLNFEIKTAAANIADMLKEQNIHLSKYDLIIPAKDATIFPGTSILIKRALPIKITADGKTVDLFTLTNTVGDAIIDSRIALGEDDLVSPKIETLLKKDLEISITRVEISEEVVEKSID